MRYEWDDQKNKSNQAKHGFDFADAHHVFLIPMVIVLDERFMEKIAGLVSAYQTGVQHNMKENATSSSSKTDWERIDAMTDDEIDVSDSPLLSDNFFSKVKLLMPGESASRQTVTVELEMDPKILAWFQSQGQDYERRMQAALHPYAEAHQANA